MRVCLPIPRRNPILSKKPISNPTLKCPVVERENQEFKRAKAVKVNVNGVEDTLSKTTIAITCTTSASKEDPIHFHDTKTQLSDKVHKFKNKYKTNATKAKLPSNPHDQQLYDCFQKIRDFQTNAAKLDTTNNKRDVPISNPTLKCPVVESKNRELKRAKAVKVKVNADGVEDTLNKTTTATTCTTSVSKNDSIHVNDTKTQLSDKVRKLKNKYKTNAIKAKLPSNPRNQQLNDLSQTIWDFQTNAAKLDTTNINKDMVHGKPILKEGALNKMVEIERELKKLQIYQLQLYLRRVELIREKTISYSFNVLKYNGLIFLNLIEQIHCFLSISLKIPDRLGQIIELLVTGIGGQFSFDGIGLIVLGDGFLLLKKIANVAND
ncbi:hypothetical protein HYC85_027789 [Camellia sinensis]|uniref:Glabrous enhancer-binding protein-like DBD domain-containing protein n=1 Tax=Camellia sinensis TaxID=4442 RepID=A0A7J7FVC3_CAMSI|nr:hypothetical protein HYC85_027789 [Camellia sinensis]